MYCSYCGEQLRDDAKFCDKCGNPTHSLAEKNNVVLDDNNKYNREIILMHLFDLRALEVEKEQLRKNIENLDLSINSLAIPGKFDPPIQKTKIGIVLSVIFLILFVISSIFAISRYTYLGSSEYYLYLRNQNSPYIGYYGDVNSMINNQKESMEGVIGLCVLGSFVSLICLLITKSNYSNYAKRNYEYQEKLKLDRKKCAYEETVKRKKQELRNNIYKEYKEVENVLEKAYTSNIIPGPFRNAYAIYYLYDYLSTSSQSISEALLHVDLNAIKNKLDYVISQNTDVILQQAQTNANLEELNKKHRDLLNVAMQTEKNTEVAAQYAQISATHEQTLVQIASAEYWHFNKDL